MKNFAHFTDPQKSLFGLLSNFVHFNHPYMNPLALCSAIRGILKLGLFYYVSIDSQDTQLINNYSIITFSKSVVVILV